jgi:hypothetical protein
MKYTFLSFLPSRGRGNIKFSWLSSTMIYGNIRALVSPNMLKKRLLSFY